jgi:tetratricopeptide (TPR) repeat protein
VTRTIILGLFLAATALASAAQQPTTTPAPATARHVPEAKTRQEFNDYNTAYALSGGAQLENAADEFAAKYPSSELKSYLYAKALHEYQNESNPGKMLAMGRKVLLFDPDHTIALVLTATVLADSLDEKDPDREQKIAEIKKDTKHALDTVDSAFIPPANATPEEVTAYKKTLRSMAHSALGITALKTQDNKTAEQELKLAADLNVTQPDPYIWYHLALAQHRQQKYPDALASINKALEYAGDHSDLADLVRNERKQLLLKNKMGEEDASPRTQPQAPGMKSPSPN